MDIHDLIEKFNNGETDFIQYVGDVKTFFKILNRRGLLDELDPEGRLSDDYQNDLLLYLYENNKEKFYKYIEKFLGDVEMVNGVANLVVNDRGELAQLFCDRRNDISQDTIKEILNGEYDSYSWSYHDLTDDVYRDVIEELTKENILHLKEYIIKTLDGEQIDTHTELLESIAQQQGHPEYVVVDQSNIDQIVDDEETMNELMDSELDDLKRELYSIYGNAYQTAYEDELYNDIWSELDDYFVGKGEWLTRPHIYKKDTTVEKFRIPIHDFESFIVEYLNANNGYSNATLEYHGSYLTILRDEIQCLSFRVSDYPDSRQIDKNINLYFTDYI